MDSPKNTDWCIIHGGAEARLLWYRHVAHSGKLVTDGTPARQTATSTAAPDGRRSISTVMPLEKDTERAEDSLFGQLWTGLEKEAVEGRVLVGEVRGSGGALEVQAADDDVEHRGHRRQLHAVEHRRQLRGDGVNV